MPNIEVKILVAQDVEDFRTIRLCALAQSPEMFGSTYRSELERPVEFFENCLLNATVFGIYQQGQIVGLAVLSQEKVAKLAHKAHLSSVFIKPEYRQKGLANQLLKTVIDYSKQHVEQILLNVAKENKSAIHLYQKFGFHCYGTEKHALKHDDEYIDEILMKLFIV